MADILSEFSFLTDGVMFFLSEGGWKNLIMWVIGGLLIFLAIKKDMEPSLLLPMGFGAILVNIPVQRSFKSDNWTNRYLRRYPVKRHNRMALPCGNRGFGGNATASVCRIGAMIDFGPLLSNPKMLFFGGAAQFGIFFTIIVATLLGFDIIDRGVNRNHRRGLTDLLQYLYRRCSRKQIYWVLLPLRHTHIWPLCP